jgi:iron complex transport system substrate-binding protein
MIKKSLPLALVITLLIHISLDGKERLLTDETGRRVAIPYPAKRIISLAPSITEILFALGLNEEIAAVTNYCDYPEAVLNKPRVGGYINPSIEKIVSLKPDLIIATRDDNRWETNHRLSALGLCVYLINPKSFHGVAKSIQHIGAAVGREEESKKIMINMTLKKEEIVKRTKSLPKPKVFFQIGYTPIMTVGRKTLADDLIRLAGGKSISENELTNYPIYSMETILSKAPEIIIISTMDSNKESMNLIERWRNWKSIPAVKMKAIHVIDSNLVDRPTPRIVEGLEILAKMIHPEVWGEKR